MGLSSQEVLYPDVKLRRDKMRDLEICINASYIFSPNARPPVRTKPRVEHGKPVRGGKCQRCLEVHAKSRKRVTLATMATDGMETR